MVKRRKRSKRRILSKTLNNGEQTYPEPPSEVSEALSLMIAKERRFKIFYWVPHDPQKLEEISLLGHYTPGLLAAAGPLMIAAGLPADIREPYTNRSNMLLHRLYRRAWPLITPVNINSIKEALQMSGTPFHVILTNEKSIADKVDLIIKEVGIPILHASAIQSDNRIVMGNLISNGIIKYTKKAINELANDKSWGSFANEAKKITSTAPLVRPKKHPLPAGLHNVVIPNEIALKAFGYYVYKKKPISEPIMTGKISPKNYISRICESADAVSKLREALLTQTQNPSCDNRYILAVPSVYWAHYKYWRTYIQKTNPEERKDVRRAFKNIVQAETYFNEIELDDFNQPLLGDFQKTINELRAMDMKAFTAGLSMLASATLTPVIRLEPKLNYIRGDLKTIADCVRSEKGRSTEWKTSRLIIKLGQKMRSAIAPEFLQRIDAPSGTGQIEGMKLVCDFPIELLPKNELPLTLRYDVSRISPLPGNLFLQQCTTPPLILEKKSFEEILIIRSFSPNDRLKPLLVDAIQMFSKTETKQKLNYRVIDVENEIEFIKALNDYHGAIVIFDCHGQFDKTLGMGTLVIGGTPLNTWNLKDKIKMPPIVMFSACDSQPIDGSHNSVATSVLGLGAHTVLATNLPINAQYAALFIGRMCLRLSEFIPAALKTRPLLTWREVISGMLRMSHYTEIIHKLIKHTNLTLCEEDRKAVSLKANIAINSRNNDWFEIFLDSLSATTGKTIDTLKEDVNKWAGLTEAIKHTQLGSPENIIIVEKNPELVIAEHIRNSGIDYDC